MGKLSKVQSVCLLSVAPAAAILFIFRGSSPGLPSPQPIVPILIKQELPGPLEKREEVSIVPEADIEPVQAPEEKSVEAPKNEIAIFSKEEKLRTKPSDMLSIEDFLARKQLENPSQSFRAGEVLSGAFIETQLAGVYKGVIQADQDYDLTLSFRNGEVIENRFTGGIFVEIGEVNGPRKTSFWNDANKRVRVVTEDGKESILIEFLARNLPVPNRMLQLLLIEDGTIPGNFYEMKDAVYVRVGVFRLTQY